jgi:sporulation protein YlmC with PRC-barrel domain
MQSRPTLYALAALLAAPGIALAQSATSPGNGGANSPAYRAPMTTNPAPIAPSGSSSSTSSNATYTTADQLTRASKIIGATVYNDQNQSVGSIDELLINNNHDVTGVVLSVGGFLGINTKLVKVPFQDIRVTGDRLVMSGATKDELKQMPDYKIVPAKAS